MSRPPEPWRAGELRLAPESIEALARRLAELIGPDQEPAAPRRERLVTAEAGSGWWGGGRPWGYDPPAHPGAKTPGAGKRPRSRFQPPQVARPPGPPPSRAGPASPGRPIGFPVCAAIFSMDRTKSGRGGARTPPGLAPKEDLRRETQPSPAGSVCRRVPFSTPEREEDTDEN